MRRVAAGIIAVSAFSITGTFAVTDLPTVHVVGYATDGMTISCSTPGCTSAANEEALAQHVKYLAMHDTAPEEPVAATRAGFCQKLRAQKPANCSLGSPPSVPGYDINWQPNGCGTGGVSNWFADFVLERISSNSYSGNLNAPYPGVSFLESCNAHDRCWGVGGSKSDCDMTFAQSMTNSCSGLGSSSAVNTCNGFAGIYHGAVATTNFGASAYANSSANYTCAAWAYDMNLNGCQN